MANAHRRNGNGHLIFNDGTQASVAWEIELGPNNTLDGIIHGDPLELARAAEDPYATLQLETSEQFGIKIARLEGDNAFFIRHYSANGWFDAKTIVASMLTESGDRLMIAFASALGDEFKVLIPTVVLRDYLPVLEQQVPPDSAGEPPTSFFRIAETWGAAVPANHPYVCIKFDDDEPVGLTPESAFLLAKELLELVREIGTKFAGMQTPQ